MVISEFSKNSDYNVIALCGQCAAKFKWGDRTPDSTIKKDILAQKDYFGSIKINFVLDGEPEHIKFAESHFNGLQSALSTED